MKLELTEEQAKGLLAMVNRSIRCYEQDDYWGGYRCRFCEGNDGATAEQAGRVQHEPNCLGLYLKSTLDTGSAVRTRIS